jgi:hypothetical protein
MFALAKSALTGGQQMISRREAVLKYRHELDVERAVHAMREVQRLLRSMVDFVNVLLLCS